MIVNRALDLCRCPHEACDTGVEADGCDAEVEYVDEDGYHVDAECGDEGEYGEPLFCAGWFCDNDSYTCGTIRKARLFRDTLDVLMVELSGCAKHDDVVFTIPDDHIDECHYTKRGRLFPL